MPIQLLICDDDALIREGLGILLSLDPEFEVCAVAENGEEAIALCRENERIDVVLLDVRMPVMDGLEALAVLAGHLHKRVMMLTTFDDGDAVTTALRHGAQGYLLKNSPPDRIKNAIRLIHAGGIVMQDEVLTHLRAALTTTPSTMEIDPTHVANHPPLPPGEKLTEREREVLDMLAMGLSNREIASRLFLGEGTVKNHITSLLAKTGLKHRTGLALWRLGRER